MTTTTPAEVVSEPLMVTPCDYRDNGRGEWVHAPWCTCPRQREALRAALRETLAPVIPLRSAAR